MAVLLALSSAFLPAHSSPLLATVTRSRRHASEKVPLSRPVQRRHTTMAAQYDDAEAVSSVSDATYLVADNQIKPRRVRKTVLFFSAYAAGFTALLVRTLMKHPLIPPATESLAWNSAWLITTVVDYYGAALALCGIILASEPRRKGILWSLGCLLLGTPFCCFYVVTRLLRKGTLRLS